MNYALAISCFFAGIVVGCVISMIVHNCMDDIRYFCNTIMKNKVRKESNYTQIFM